MIASQSLLNCFKRKHDGIENNAGRFLCSTTFGNTKARLQTPLADNVVRALPVPCSGRLDKSRPHACSSDSADRR